MGFGEKHEGEEDTEDKVSDGGSESSSERTIDRYHSKIHSPTTPPPTSHPTHRGELIELWAPIGDYAVELKAYQVCVREFSFDGFDGFHLTPDDF